MSSHAERVTEIIDRELADVEEYRGSFREELSRLWRDYLVDSKPKIFVALFFTGLLSVHPYLSAMCTRFLVDRVLLVDTGFPQSQFDQQVAMLWVYVFMLIMVWGTSLVSNWVSSWAIHTTGQNLVYSLRKQLHEKLQALHIGYYERTPTGRILSRVLDDVRVIQKWVTAGGVTITTHVGRVLIGLCVIFLMDWRLSVFVVASLPVYAYAFYRMRPAIRRKNLTLRRINSQLYARASERVAGISVVQAFGAERREYRKFAHTVFEMLRVHMRLILLSQRLRLLSVIIASIMTGIVLYWVMRSVRTGDMSLGYAMAYLLSVQALFEPVNSLTSHMTALQQVMVVLRRVFRLIDEDVGVVSGKIQLTGMVGKIRFENVSFTYPDQGACALRGISFRVQPGERVAIIGPSGSGKSTIFELLMRFYDPGEGQIRVGGVNLADADCSSIRWHVCMVQQEPVVFSGTIADNIMYGRADASRDMVINAARQAELDEFVASLPKGYDTWVGERGVTLSGGQKQRLALATALLTDPEVLLLDDTTSALDARTEARIRKTLEHVMEGRTSLMITQRVSASRGADRIMVLEDGVITQEGTHDRLVLEDGFYGRICAQQGAL